MPFKVQINYRLKDESVVSTEPELFGSWNNARLAAMGDLINCSDEYLDKIVISIEYIPVKKED